MPVNQLFIDVFFVSGNKFKIAEVEEKIGKIKTVGLDIPEIQELDIFKIVEAKANFAYNLLKQPVLVEDTALYLEALEGLPGPLVKWFLYTIRPIGVYQLAERHGNLRAKATSLFGLKRSADSAVIFGEGSVNGHLVPPVADEGFGFDLIFVPDGADKTFSEMDTATKSTFSHRGKALEQLIIAEKPISIH